MLLFLETYEKYTDSPKAIEEADIDALFNAFSTNAWVPISTELANRIDEEI